MSTPKIKLLNTVKALNEQGVTDLTASEKAQIEKETQDLIKNSKKKRAMKAPEGFEEVVEKLNGVDADEAFKIVTDFLKDKGLLGHQGVGEDKGKEDLEEIEEGMEKMEKGKGEGESEEDEEEELEGFDKKIPVKVESPKEEKEESKEEEIEEHKGLPKGLEKHDDGEIMKEGPKGPMGPMSEGPMKGKKEEIKEDLMKDLSDTKALRDKVIAQAMELSSEEKKKRMQEMQDKDEDKKSEDMPAMGMEAGLKVIVTANKNILVANNGKPVFHAVVAEEIKKDTNKLARLANRVSGWLVTEGIKKTADRCKAKIIAGVDEGIDFGGQKLPEEKDGVDVGGETDAVESHEGDSGDSVLEGADADTQEKHDDKVARYRVVSETISDVSEGGVDEIEKDRPKRETEVTNGAQDEIVEEREEKEESTQEDAQFDIKNLEANYKKLYANKARQLAAKAQDDFTKKFSRCLSIASQRMLKNLCYNPMKSASADVLMSTNIQFSNGDRYAGMDEAAAVELTELIASEGHERFLEALLQYTADLMDKEDGYLKDVESDLQSLSPVPVEVTASRKASNANLREEAVEGSVAIQAKRASTGPQNNSVNDMVSKALSGTRVGRRLSKF